MTGPSIRWLKLTIAYDGTEFSGWQVQTDRRTVQAVLEQALTAITGESNRVVASGRTDAGVHALAQVVSVSTSSYLSCDVLVRALNANLPDDVAVLRVDEASVGFHAIRDAVRKRYRYVVRDEGVRDVFARRYYWHHAQPLDVAAMQRAARALVGRHDFASFQSSGADRVTTVRTVYELSVERKRADYGDGSQIVIEVEADGFLYNMVRAIVGTLVEVGRGAESESWPAEVLAARDRRAGGPTAPPQGLFLVRVEYGE
jgi:tRNA pseudouridine38-40 synthase